MAEHFFPAEQAELWRLIDERAATHADTASVDRRIWEQFGDHGAVMFTDLAGFTRRSAELGITHFLQIILQSQKILRPVIADHEGTVFEVVGDSMLLWFKPVDLAIRCAVAMQQACREFNKEREPHDQVLLCLGVGYGRLLRVGNSRLAGAELNVASKLGEDIAEGYEILVSDAARKAVGELPQIEFRLTGITLPGSPEVYRVEY